MTSYWVKIRLLNCGTSNSLNQQSLVSVLFPTFIFFHYLVSHVTGDAVCTFVHFTIVVFSIYFALYYFVIGNKCRVRTTMILHCSNSNQWELNVRSTRPRESFFLYDLQSQFTSSFITLFPI